MDRKKTVYRVCLLANHQEKARPHPCVAAPAIVAVHLCIWSHYSTVKTGFSADRGIFGSEMFSLSQIVGCLSHMSLAFSSSTSVLRASHFPLALFSAAPVDLAHLLRLWSSCSPVRHGLVEASCYRWRLLSSSLFAGDRWRPGFICWTDHSCWCFCHPSGSFD